MRSRKCHVSCARVPLLACARRSEPSPRHGSRSSLPKAVPALPWAQVSEEEMERRLLKRGESSGRSDDNAQSIIKRFRTFVSESMPVIDELERRGVVHKVNAEAGPDEVYSRVCETIGRHPRPVLPKE